VLIKTACKDISLLYNNAYANGSRLASCRYNLFYKLYIFRLLQQYRINIKVDVFKKEKKNKVDVET